MAKKEKKSKKSNGIKIDFTGVEARAAAHPEGRFAFAVEDVEVKTSENSGNDYLQWVLKSSKGKVYYITSLASHALWNLKSVLEAAGQDVPDGELEIDIDELKELEFGGEVVHEKYEGKTKGVIAEVFPVDEVEGDSEESDDEESDDEESDDDEVTFESVQEMDLDELLELASDNDIKVTKKQQKDVDALRDFLCEKLELEEEEEEEGEEPTYEEVQEMDEEDLDALVEEHELKIKAKDKKKIAKYRDAVCEALELEEGDEEEEEEEEEDTSSKKGKKAKK